jgi:signal transduction histidine kinase
VIRLSLRWRLMLIGATGLVVSLLLAGWLLLSVLGWAFDHSVDASARQTGTDLAGLIAVGQLPQPVPVAGTQIVQVLDGNRRIKAGSPGADRLVPLLQPDELALALTGQAVEIDGSRIGLDGQLRVSAIDAGPASAPAAQRQAVIIAAPLGDIEEATAYLRVALLSLLVPLVAGLAVVAWWVIGRTLRPVEALRAGAEEITGQAGTDADQRLPVPVGKDEIHRLAVTLNGMLDRLGSARRRQRQFVADAAHELRNPLAGMRTQLEVARRHPDGTVWPELVEDLLIDTERLGTLADDLLLLARADEGVVGRTPVAVPVEEALSTVAARYRTARVPVRFEEGTATELLVRADPDDLHRILTNLTDNAVRHARTGVRLAADRVDGQVRITVTDDGPGIPEADRSRVFARFTRLDDARAIDDGGTGLGLAIVATLLRRQHATITLTDAPSGPGLRAEVLLPPETLAGP